MRLGFISDIHGDLVSLEHGVRFLERKGVDVILCLGDIVSFGPDPNGCVELLRAKAVRSIAGNDDVAMIAPGEAPEPTSERLRQIHTINGWCRSSLTSESASWLRGLDEEIRLSETLLGVHAAPGDNKRIVTSEMDKPFPAAVHIVCAGHLHVPFVSREHEKTWVNVGSVGSPTDGDARGSVSVVTATKGVWDAEIHRLDRPMDQILERIRLSGIPFADRLCETKVRATWW